MPLEFTAGHRFLPVLMGCATVWAVLIAFRRRDAPSPVRWPDRARLLLRLTTALALAVGILEPRLVRSVRSHRPGLLILAFDRSASMETIDLGTNASRLAVAERWLGSESARKLKAEHEIRIVGFAGQAAALPDDPASWSSSPVARPEQSDWTTIVPFILSPDPDAPAPEGVIVFSDGRFSKKPDDPLAQAAIARLRQAGSPIFGVAPGSNQAPRDIALRSIQGPARGFPGDDIRLEAVLELNGMAGETVEVVLERPGVAPSRQRIAVDSDRAAATVAFSAQVGPESDQEFTISATQAPNEARADNQRLTHRVAAISRKARILLIEAEPSWEFRYLRNALGRDPQVEVESVLLDPPPALGDPGSVAYRSEPPESLEDWDAIVMGDLDVRVFGDSRWRAVADWTAERGGLLALRSGRGQWLSGLEGTAIGRGLLPIRRPTPVAIADPATSELRPQPNAEALKRPESWPILQLGANPEESGKAWATAPPLRALTTGQLKPGAEALAQINGSAIVMAAQRYGAGRVLFLGTGDLWRWRDRIGDRLHHRFWGRLARWSALESLEAGNRFARFGPTRFETPAGEAVRIETRLRSDLDPSVRSAARLAVRIRDRRDKAEPRDAVIATLRPSADRPGVYEGEVSGLPPGDYEARLEADEPRVATAIEQDRLPAARLRIVEPPTAERVDLAADPEGLRRLAEATGGESLSIADSDNWPNRIPKRPRETIRREGIPIWSHPLAIGLMMLLLISDWIARLWFKREESKRHPS